MSGKKEEGEGDQQLSGSVVHTKGQMEERPGLREWGEKRLNFPLSYGLLSYTTTSTTRHRQDIEKKKPVWHDAPGTFVGFLLSVLCCGLSRRFNIDILLVGVWQKLWPFMGEKHLRVESLCFVMTFSIAKDEWCVEFIKELRDSPIKRISISKGVATYFEIEPLPLWALILLVVWLVLHFQKSNYWKY